MTKKINAIDRNVSILINLSVFMAESMSATKYDKTYSPLYQEAVDELNKEIKRHTSHSELLINE